MAVGLQRAAVGQRQGITSDVREARRGDLEQQRAIGGQIANVGHADAGLNGAAEGFQVLDQCIGNRLGTAFGHGPPHGMTGDAQHHADGR